MARTRFRLRWREVALETVDGDRVLWTLPEPRVAVYARPGMAVSDCARDEVGVIEAVWEWGCVYRLPSGERVEAAWGSVSLVGVEADPAVVEEDETTDGHG